MTTPPLGPAPLGKVVVRETATGREHYAWPVDARELVASGEYVCPAWSDTAKPVFPLPVGVAPTRVPEKPKAAGAPVVAPVVESVTESVTVEPVASEQVAAEPATAEPTPKAKGRKPKGKA